MYIIRLRHLNTNGFYCTSRTIILFIYVTDYWPCFLSRRSPLRALFISHTSYCFVIVIGRHQFTSDTARTPFVLFFSMAKTSRSHPGSPNPSPKRIMSSRKKTTTAKATTPRKKTMKVVVNTGTDEHSKRVAQRALPLLTRCKSPPQKQSQDQQMPTLRPVANSLRPV